MKKTYVAAKLFFALAAVFTFAGVVRFNHDTIGSGLSEADYWVPLCWVTIPRLIPFTAAICSVFFAIAYYVVEQKSKRPLNVPLTLVHMVSFLLAILAHATLVSFWWKVSGENATNPPMPLWAGTLVGPALVVCFSAFGTNIFWNISRTQQVMNSSQYQDEKPAPAIHL